MTSETICNEVSGKYAGDNVACSPTLSGAPCCLGTAGNVNGVGGIDLSDLSALVSFLTGGSFVPECPDAANANGSGTIDLSDLSTLVSYLTGGGVVLPSCP